MITCDSLCVRFWLILGDIVGTVKLKLLNRKKVRGVYIEFKGDARTEWYKDVEKDVEKGDGGSENDRKTETVREWYRGNENYLSSKIFLSGGSSGMRSIHFQLVIINEIKVEF